MDTNPENWEELSTDELDEQDLREIIGEFVD